MSDQDTTSNRWQVAHTESSAWFVVSWFQRLGLWRNFTLNGKFSCNIVVIKHCYILLLLYIYKIVTVIMKQRQKLDSLHTCKTHWYMFNIQLNNSGRQLSYFLATYSLTVRVSGSFLMQSNPKKKSYYSLNNICTPNQSKCRVPIQTEAQPVSRRWK